MRVILPLLCLPLVFSAAVLLARTQRAYAWIVRTASVAIMASSVLFFLEFYGSDGVFDTTGIAWLKPAMLIAEAALAIYFIYVGVKRRSLLLCLISVAQIALTAWFEITHGHDIAISSAIYIDKLTILMVAIAGIIGGLICIYAVEYMKDYHRHHPEIPDRRNVFFAILLLFLSAMFGLLICNDMSMTLFFWEITTLCSFLLIGYTKTEEAIKNSVTALTINALGGLCFAVGIVLLGVFEGLTDFNGLLLVATESPAVSAAVFLIASAGLTKSAQLPFSKWLLGAMVAPTPTSAMLHSSTMVKAGVFLIIRLSPLLGRNAAGISITLLGSLTFLIAAILAVSQSDSKKILAYSTMSNLGLIVACAGINTAESLWAAIMLIVFHAIAKSLLFLAVGSTEHQLGSRNVEDMDGLFKISFTLTMLLIIGIAGMFVAPFGMLISKWAAMKAFVDSGNILIVLMIAYGSSVTLFYWTKWMGKLIGNVHHFAPQNYIMRNDEKVSMYSLAALVVIVCAIHPVISSRILIPYINDHMHISFVSPIDPLVTVIVLFMLLMLFILPLVAIPFYRYHRVKETSVYLAGRNTGDNDSFFGSAGKTQQVQLKNWYMKDIINESKTLSLSYILCCIIILGGLFIAMGGVFV